MLALSSFSSVLTVYSSMKFVHICGILVPSTERMVHRWEERKKIGRGLFK